MKKAFIFLALLVTIFSHTIVQAETFTLIDSNFLIEGRLTVWPYGQPGPSDSYNTNSATPIADQKIYQESYVKSRASYNDVYADVFSIFGDPDSPEPWYHTEGYALATATIDFRPNFSGNDSTIIFTQYSHDSTDGGHSYTQIRWADLTASTNLFEGFYSSVGEIGFWTPSDGWYTNYPVYGPFLYPFTYAGWTPDHVYRLVIGAFANEANLVEDGYANVTTDIRFSNVPLPVRIDIRPASINIKKTSQISVAILSTGNCDAFAQIDRDPLTFGLTGNEDGLNYCVSKPKDLNRDWIKDLLCYFDIADAGLQCGENLGILNGYTVGGLPITGSDSVALIQCR